MVGKRKRDLTVISRATSKPEDDDSTGQQPPPDAQDLLRQYFEARFEPLEHLQPTNRVSTDFNDFTDDSEEEEDSDASDEPDWDGVSSEESSEEPEVVDHSNSNITKDIPDKVALKSFMVGYLPSV